MAFLLTAKASRHRTTSEPLGQTIRLEIADRAVADELARTLQTTYWRDVKVTPLDGESFYLVRLIDADDGVLASEEIWANADAVAGSPERVALDAASYFSTDSHDQNPAGNRVQLFGPFIVDAAAPAHVFDIAEDDREDAPDYWTATPAGS